MERMEKDQGMDIKQRAAKNSLYTEKELQMLVEMLMFTKWFGVAHRDIKPANLFADKGHYRLEAFGSAREVEEVNNVPNGTTEYLSPEMRR